MDDISIRSTNYFENNQTATVIEPVFDVSKNGVKTYTGKVLVRFHNPAIPSPQELMYPAAGGDADYGGGIPTSGTIVLVGWSVGNYPIILNTYQKPAVGEGGSGNVNQDYGDKIFIAAQQTDDSSGLPSSIVRKAEYGARSDGTFYAASHNTGAYLTIGGIDETKVSPDSGNPLIFDIGTSQASIGMDNSGGVIINGLTRIAQYCNNLAWRIRTAASLFIQALTVTVPGTIVINVDGNTTVTSKSKVVINATGNVEITSASDIKFNGGSYPLICLPPGALTKMGDDLSSLACGKIHGK